MFLSRWHTDSGNVSLIGVVLGQHGHNLAHIVGISETTYVLATPR